MNGDVPVLTRRASEREASDLAEARERFLRVESAEPEGVRQAILASWWRSRQFNIAADHLEPLYVRDPNLDTPLTRSAEPVLAQLREQLDGQPLSIVLTDAAGVVLSRHSADASLDRHLDRVNLAPGFSYSEAVVGTNGIGTALEAGRAMHVFGHEHYAENLEDLACAGVPIRHPVSGKTVGALDLTCWRKDASPLLVTLAKTTADQIRQALLTETGLREIELLHAYIRACRHSTGMVFALNNDVVMMNESARTTLAASDQTALLRHAAEAMAEGRENVTVELPSGVFVRISSRPVQSDGRIAGGVVSVRVEEAAHHLDGRHRTPAPMLLPGLVGSGSLWRRACVDIEAGYREGDWLIVEGESGAGKLSLVRALHQRMNPAGRCVVLDGSDEATDTSWLTRSREVLKEDEGTFVLRNLHLLPDRPLRVLTSALQEAVSREDFWVALTLSEEKPKTEFNHLLALFPRTVHVPPLRHHIEDLEQLVPFFLLRLGHGGQLSASSEALQLMLRYTWPGNVSQVLDTLRQVLKHRRTGVLQPSDLPPEVRSGSRHRLSALESLERDAIVLALADANGNKAKAARALGVSRATIYRKIHDYGVTFGSSS